MDKFSKEQKNSIKGTDEIKDIYKGSHLSIVNYKEWDIVQSKDRVVILPFFKDEGCILMRNEYLPSYNLRFKGVSGYKDVTNYLTVISGAIDEGETPIQTIRRELVEEAGVVLSNLYEINIGEQVFADKGVAYMLYFTLLEINYNDFRLIQPPTDGSKGEQKSKTVRISLGEIDSIKIYDLLTAHMLLRLKNEYNLK
jgi:8-oxo-dGTP pyrophosphatase MutT (NUDIX family)